jgi:ligand-binding sensor domain-containing protein
MFQKTIRNIILILLSCAYLNLFSQDIPIGDWRDHLPYTDAVSVSYGNNVVYCATNSAIFMYDKGDMSIERLNFVNGLSDIGLSKIKYNNYNNKVIVTYTNGNIDIIDENKNITNISFVKNSTILGSKTINHIYLQGKIAYLSTGFGIVVLDTENLEISETYLFGPLGSYIVTNALTIDNQYIYAATEEGVYFANKNSANLIDYNEWSLLPDLGTTNYSNIVEFSGNLFVSSESNVWNGDTIYYNNSGFWQKFLPNGANLENMCVSGGNTLALVWNNGITFFDISLSQYNYINSYNTINATPKELFIDNESNNWIADNKLGLVKYKTTGYEIISPNGPSSSKIFDMDFKNDDLWVVSGGYNESSFVPNYDFYNLINYRTQGSWSDTPEKINNFLGNTAYDAVCVAINPSNKNQVYVGSWDNGLFEFNHGSVSNIYTAQNSLLDSTFFGTTKVGALAFDSDNNLWVSTSFTNNQLAVKTPNSSEYSFSFSGGISANNVFTKMIIDNNNYKWIVDPRENIILVFDHSGTLDNNNDDRVAILLTDTFQVVPVTNYSFYNPGIPGNYIYSIVEDLDGEIWLGTDEGIAVFYNPASVFDDNIQAEQIYIQQDGQTQILLETEAISAIAVDGANRKWIGTRNSGVFLMSEDGTEEIEHFTTENSPLFSNNIFDIVINQKTGEVFFGTEKGLVSYKGTATEADDDFTNIFVYPNPVKPDFNGTIAIRGLVEDTDVRITDISGNIVYQTTSLGGQAIWDGKDFNGNRVHTGVYMVFNGSPDGNKKAAAKILFIH